MTEPPADPPLVTRPDPSRPRPALLEAMLWCVVFVAVQACSAVVVLVIVFGAYTLAAPEPGKFVDEQLAGFQQATAKTAEGERPPMPNEFGQALAWGMLAAQFGSLGLIAVVLPWRIGRDWKRQIGVCVPRHFHLLLVLLIAPGFMIAADLIQSLFLWATGMQPTQTGLKSVFGRFPWPLAALAIAVGPGVVEELWCRGFLGRGLCSRYGIVAGVALTALLFAAMHVDPSQLFVIALMGAYLHFVYITTRCIWVPVLLHALNNGLGLLIDLALGGVVAFPQVAYLVAFALVVFGSVALWTSRAELEPVTLADEAWWESDGWKPESPGVSAPPPDANVRLAHAAVSPAALSFTLILFAALVALAVQFAR